MTNIARRGWLAMVGTAFVGGVAPLGMAPIASAQAGKGEETKRPKRTFQSIEPRELIRRRHFPNVELVTHEGEKVRFYDDLVKGKKAVINFMYAHCENICPPVMYNLTRVQKRLGDRVGRDIFMYSITLKPEEDTPEVLKAHAKALGVRPGWVLLTGRSEDIEMLRRRLRFTYDDPIEDADKSNHIGHVRYGNEPAVRWAMCPGQAPADWVASAILAEADGPTRVTAALAKAQAKAVGSHQPGAD
ncbi:MAG: SCO family protein [Verrucomicrobiales bacterium]|nr:SCO family protein [Verrucomicrobiales bacterium]